MIPEHALARATAQRGLAAVEARAERDMCPMCGEVQTVACAGGVGVRGQCERCGHELAVDDSLLMLLGNGCLHVCAHVCARMCSVYLSVSVTVLCQIRAKKGVGTICSKIRIHLSIRALLT